MKGFSVLAAALFFSSLIYVSHGVINPTQAQLDANDNNVLQFALTLELLDSAFYNQFQTTYNRNAFIAAGYNGTDWDNLELLRLQEIAHVNALQATYFARTGTNVPVCTYNFGAVTTIQQYVGGARLFENVGQAAYDGAIGAIYNRTLQQAAATIATVEARHAAFLNTLVGQIPLPAPFPAKTSPFPNATDNAFPPMTVSQLVSPFLTSCPYNVTAIFPQVLVVIPVANPNGVPANPTQAQVSANDIAVLNYALTLELLEATFYNRYLATYTLSSFLANGLTSDDYNYFLLIGAHENAHVSFLQQNIPVLGGVPVVNCTYTFPVTDFTTFVSTAMLLENTGVSAYDGAANRLTDPGLRQIAATIATVEARHAAYINSLKNRTNWFPNSQDTPLAPDVVLSAIAGIVSNCPIPAPVPQALVVVPYSNGTSTGTTGATSSTTRGGVTSTGNANGNGAGSTSTSAGSSSFSLFSSGIVCLVAALLLIA